MTEEQFVEGIKARKRVTKASSPYPWCFAAHGPEAEPMLSLGEKEAPTHKLGCDVRKQANEKTFAFGRIRADGPVRLNFAIDEGTARSRHVQRPFEARLDKLVGFERVKRLLQQAIIHDSVAFDTTLAAVAEQPARGKEVAQTSTITNPLAARHALAKGVARAKIKETKPKARSGGSGTEFDELTGQQVQGGKALDAADAELKQHPSDSPPPCRQDLLLAEIQAFEELSDASPTVEMADEKGEKDAPVDLGTVNTARIDSFDEGQGQLENLRVALRGTGNPELAEKDSAVFGETDAHPKEWVSLRADGTQGLFVDIQRFLVQA